MSGTQFTRSQFVRTHLRSSIAPQVVCQALANSVETVRGYTLTVPGGYGGHCRKRATISGVYQGTSAATLRLMQPVKNVAQ
jgi:hypothetical protein